MTNTIELIKYFKRFCFIGVSSIFSSLIISLTLYHTKNSTERNKIKTQADLIPSYQYSFTSIPL